MSVKGKSGMIHLFIQMSMVSLYFGTFNLYIGFSLKPYMIIAMVCILLLVRYMKFGRLLLFEWLMIFFILYFMSTALNFNYPVDQLRFMLLFIIILIYYFSNRGLFAECSIADIERMLSNAGLIGVIASLTYYIIGIAANGINYVGIKTTYYGVMLDRAVPRLIGTPSRDPNITAFFVTLYFFYTLSNLRKKNNVIGFILSLLCIVFTFSRGAYLSIFMASLLFFIISKNRKEKYKAAALVIVIIVLIFNLTTNFFINPVELISERFLKLFQDGGSGRETLWNFAFDIFLQNPIFGTGINTLRQYGSGNEAHSVILEVLAESGLIGLFLYLTFWLSIFYFCIKLLRKDNSTKFILLTFTSMFLQMLFLSILYNEAFYFMLLVLYKYSEAHCIGGVAGK